MQQEAAGARAPSHFRRFLDDPGLVTMLDQWCALRREAGGHLPPRRALDPMNVRKLLPFIEVYRRMSDGRIRCCLSGTAIRNETGREYTGLHLDEILPLAALASRAALFDRALDTGMPVAYRCHLPVPSREHKATTRLLLPLADETGQATIVVSMVIFRLVPLSLSAPQADPAAAPDALAAEEAELDPGSMRAVAAA